MADNKKLYYTPTDLKILIDALNVAPTYLSKRFVLKNLCGWSDEMIKENMAMRREEQDQMKVGDKVWQ